MSSTTNGLKRKQESDASSASASASRLEMPAEKIRCCVPNILDLPNEVLNKIMLFLNARERVGFGNSCKRFNSLVFSGEELLRNLDFSSDGCLTLASEVLQYFNNEYSRSKVLAVNISNTDCMKSGHMLNDSIGKARNLVDVNIHGLQFKDIWQLGCFLNPLPYVRRFSFDWPEISQSHIPICCKLLQQPFSRLTYLSVAISTIDRVTGFISCLRLCQELEELRITVKKSNQSRYVENWSGEPKELKNLRVMEYCGPFPMEIKERCTTLLPNPEKWADFQMDSTSDRKGFYLAIVDVCEELADSEWFEKIPNVTPENRLNAGWALIPEILLREVLKITHENVPGELCCLSTFMKKQRCLLKISEAKRLLKNPRSQISYLCINHPIALGCDVHLLASAFANLTELQLAAVTTSLDSFSLASHFQRRLRRRGEVMPEEVEETLNMDSSFKMLVENTPRLRHFTLGGSDSYENWDLEELHLISKWKYLQSLRLVDIPIKDGKFLIEIGKQCESLQKLELIRLGPYDCCYEPGLLRMLMYCQNLRDFSMEATYLKKPYKLFSCLANNVHLGVVRMKTTYPPSSTAIASDQQCLVSSITQLLRQCSQLTTFVGDFDCSTGWNLREHLSSIQQRWLKKLNRPCLQIKMRWGSLVEGSVSEDSPPFNPFPKMSIMH